MVFLQPETLASATCSGQQFTLSRAQGWISSALVSLRWEPAECSVQLPQPSPNGAVQPMRLVSAGWFSKHPVLAGGDATEVHCGSFFLQQVLSMIINAAYKPGRVLRELQLVEDPHWNFQEETLKAK